MFGDYFYSILLNNAVLVLITHIFCFSAFLYCSNLHDLCGFVLADTIRPYSPIHNWSSWSYIGFAWWFRWISSIYCCVMLTDGAYLKLSIFLYSWMELMFSYDFFMPLIYLIAQVLESSPHDAVEPILFNLSVRLRNIQVRFLTFAFLCTKILLIWFMALQI